MLFRGGLREEAWLAEAGVEGEGVCELLAVELPLGEGPPIEAPGVGRLRADRPGVSSLTSEAAISGESASTGDFQNRPTRLKALALAAQMLLGIDFDNRRDNRVAPLVKFGTFGAEWRRVRG